MNNTNQQTESGAEIVASAINGMETLIKVTTDRISEFDNYYLSNKKLTSRERDFAIKMHFALRTELSTYRKVLRDLLFQQKVNQENA